MIPTLRRLRQPPSMQLVRYQYPETAVRYLFSASRYRLKHPDLAYRRASHAASSETLRRHTSGTPMMCSDRYSAYSKSVPVAGSRPPVRAVNQSRTVCGCVPWNPPTPPTPSWRPPTGRGPALPGSVVSSPAGTRRPPRPAPPPSARTRRSPGRPGPLQLPRRTPRPVPAPPRPRTPPRRRSSAEFRPRSPAGGTPGRRPSPRTSPPVPRTTAATAGHGFRRPRTSPAPRAGSQLPHPSETRDAAPWQPGRRHRRGTPRVPTSGRRHPASSGRVRPPAPGGCSG